MSLAISSLYAQDSYMRNILEVAAPIVEYIEVENSQEIVRMEFDIVSSGPKFTYRDLHSGYTYGICAFGGSAEVETNSERVCVGSCCISSRHGCD